MPSLMSVHSIRNPGKRVQPIKQRQKVLSHAEKQSRALAAAQNKINSEALHKQVRKANLYNAYVHDLFEKEIAAGGHKTLRELQEEVKARMEDAGVSHVKDLISDEEIVRLRGELKDATELKRVGIRATNKVAAMDSYQTMKNMAEGAMNLFERVGVREDSSLPHCFDSDGALDFCLEVLGFSKVDLLRMFEAWNCVHDRGGHNSNDVNALCKKIVKLIEDSLRKTVKDKNAKMSYKN
ncbi:hypothetical protein GGX14DRAFT_570599 [Mycena pura]|uniref:Uncharacterized protein n=1 Tax=Mycena pura TaxID=153505 RepID=A0AAD6V5B5_9AGAR|nr:hypothetical protein GGX14DRAFT_570599 [Mycena pura]